MFGFGGNRELKELADKIGRLFHHQLTEAMMLKDEVFNNPDEIAFTSGYLKAYFHQMFTHHGNADHHLEAKLFKKTCNGVIPKRLWEIYVKGEELGQLAEMSNIEQIQRTGHAYERGIIAGVEDADETHIQGTIPNQLAKFLSGK